MTGAHVVECGIEVHGSIMPRWGISMGAGAASCYSAASAESTSRCENVSRGQRRTQVQVRVGGLVRGAVAGVRALPQAVRAADVPGTLRSATVEAAWVGAHVALYPWSARRERASLQTAPLSPSDLSLVQRSLYVSDVEAAGTPIILVHGIADNRSIFTLLRRALRRRGFRHVHAFGYGLFASDLRAVAGELSDYVEQICDELGVEQVHLIGHSLGGLVARYYVQRLGGDDRVHTVVTLGTPHGGTLPARLLPHPLLRALCPGSDLIAEL